MSDHTKQAIKILEDAGKKPIGAMNYMCDDDDIGSVPADILPDDDMALELALCQTMTILIRIKEGKSHRYDHKDLAAFNTLKEIYARAGETIGDHGIGIEHAASWAYDKLDKWLNFMLMAGIRRTGFWAWMDPASKADFFIEFMKALLLSHVIAKSPLSNANDISPQTAPRKGLIRDEGIRG